MNNCEYCSSPIGLRNGGGVHLWGWAGVGWDWEETAEYEIVDEIIHLNSRQSHIFSNQQKLKVVCIMHTSD